MPSCNQKRGPGAVTPFDSYRGMIISEDSAQIELLQPCPQDQETLVKEKDYGLEVIYVECLLYAGSCVRPWATQEREFLFNGVYILTGEGKTES